MKKTEADKADANAELMATTLERVVNDAANGTVQIEHLNATIRDALLTHIRAMKDPWSKLSEKHQQEKISAIEETAREVIRVACATIASRGFDSIDIRLKDLSIKDSRIKGKFEATMTGDSVQLLAEHEDMAALIVLAAPGAFMCGPWGEAEPDQTEIPLASEEEDLQGDDQRRAAGRARR